MRKILFFITMFLLLVSQSSGQWLYGSDARTPSPYYESAVIDGGSAFKVSVDELFGYGQAVYFTPMWVDTLGLEDNGGSEFNDMYTYTFDFSPFIDIMSHRASVEDTLYGTLLPVELYFAGRCVVSVEHYAGNYNPDYHNAPISVSRMERVLVYGDGDAVFDTLTIAGAAGTTVQSSVNLRGYPFHKFMIRFEDGTYTYPTAGYTPLIELRIATPASEKVHDDAAWEPDSDYQLGD